MSQPSALAGLRIADFGRVLAAPYATMMLADLGAEVIKIERPGGGDETRAWGPPWSEGQSTYFLGANRNKQSRIVDLTTKEGREDAEKLIASCDVVVENFRPGTMERFGLGFETLSARHPGLVYCSVTGFGSGPGADLPGYDLVIQAVGGLMSITGHGEAGPTKVGVALVDVITGLHAVSGILAALRYRDKSGSGQLVEVNLLSSLLSALANQASGYVCTGAVPGLVGNRHPSIAPYEVLATADRPLAVAAANDKLFELLADVMGRRDLLDDPRFVTNSSRVEHRKALVDELEGTLSLKPADEWFGMLTAAGVPCGPINDVAQAFSLATELGLEPVVEISSADARSPSRQVSNPISLSRTPPTYRSAPPPYVPPPGGCSSPPTGRRPLRLGRLHDMVDEGLGRGGDVPVPDVGDADHALDPCADDGDLHG
jgi:crotonobetainyl-CoA:carnitine CoA-transferase CaiB-like acyl-CoA transferase